MTTIPSRLPAFSHQDIWALPAMSPAYETLMRLCDVGKTTVAQMIKEGTTPVPVIPVGRQLRVRKIDILNFLGLTEETGASPVYHPGESAGNDEAARVPAGPPLSSKSALTSK